MDPSSVLDEKYKLLRYRLIREGRRYSVECDVCKRVLKNTAYARLNGHRNICKIEGYEMPQKFPVRNKYEMFKFKIEKGPVDNFTGAYKRRIVCQICFKAVPDKIKLMQMHRTICHIGATPMARPDQVKPSPIITTIYNTKPQFKQETSTVEKNIRIKSETSFDFRYLEGKSVAKCLNCNRVLLNTNESRLEEHRKICFGGSKRSEDNNSSAEYEDEEMPEVAPAATNPFDEEYPEVDMYSSFENPVTNPGNSNSQIFVDEWKVIKTEVKEQKNPTPLQSEERKMTNLLTKFLFNSNSPLSLVESDSFKAFISALSPSFGFTLPSTNVLSTTLLDDAYEKCVSKDVEIISDASVLMIDRWENDLYKNNIVCSIRSTNGNYAYLTAYDVSEPEMLYIVKDCIAKAQSIYNTKIYAVVSHSKIECGGLLQSLCSSTVANSIASSVMDTDYSKQIVTLITQFRTTTLRNKLYNDNGLEMAIPIRDIRSYQKEFTVVLQNRFILEQLAGDDSPLSEDQFIVNLRHTIECINECCKLFDVFEKRSSSIADAVNCWLDFTLPKEFESQVNSCKQMVFNKYALTAYYLHPNYDINKLSNTQLDEIHEFLFEQLDGKGIEDWHAYKDNLGVFYTLAKKNISSASVFWSMAKRKHPSLSNLAVTLLNIPAATECIQRHFLTGHTPMCNNIPFEQANKLLHIYYSNLIENHIVLLE